MCLNDFIFLFPTPLRGIIIGYDPPMSQYLNRLIFNEREWKHLFRECYNFSYDDGDHYEYFKNRSKRKIFTSDSMEHHFLFIQPDNSLLAFGENHYGQLGTGTISQKDHQIIKPTLKKIIETVSVNNYSLILLDDATVLAAGFNQYGQLGFGDNKNRSNFEEIKSFPRNIETVYCYQFYILIKLDDGRLFISGNSVGLPEHLGIRSNSFVHIKNAPNKIDEIVYNCNSLVIKTIDGDIYVAGENERCQLGIPKKTEIAFTKIENIPPVDKIFGSDDVTFLILKDGRMMTSGSVQTGEFEGFKTDRFVFVNNIPAKIMKVHLTWRSILETSDKKFYLNPNTDRDGKFKTKYYEEITNLPSKTIDIHTDHTKWPNIFLAFTSDRKIYVSRHHHSKLEFSEIPNAPETISQIIYTREAIVIEDYTGTIWTYQYNYPKVNKFIKYESHEFAQADADH